MPPERVVFVGAVTLDTIALVDHMPGPDERHIAEDLVRAGGGPAATAAVAAARLGLADVHFVGAVGDDEDGDRAVASLAEEGVGVSGVVRVPSRPTGASVVLVDRSRGTRAICTRRVPEPVLPARSPAVELVRTASWVHVDHLGWPAVSGFPAGPGSEGTDHRPRLSVDAGNPIPGYHPRGVALDVPTDASLTARYGTADLETALARAVGDGADCVVATRGARGSVALTADGRRASAPGLPVDLVSTLGAGDVFHGALLTAVVRGEPLVRCLEYANAVAALSCRGLDGRSHIPTHRETTAFLSAAVSAARP
ncbi:ribokinase [Streptomyces oryzae]|uniref:Ribokinase n=1 Tax=Streptomyces oryzae TaxID=1434886 RepID=A0ABS3XAG4_9ACTN|nr:PfkB family carbohydrate kinase [Streptomyces oryzae]MBO8192294.1 ribokinase [Streptomyces oryzae]